ncbi:hypothetical protein JR316_0013417 [Psilocybe cubensis]|uniref:Fork-head domain-containing protein n=2 Tax=Psilocybe cubensis TaxID=181762 RepID=A0A8H7XLI2_PSICU|nr:uncharacterized protein JR316_0013417 [Psilocybe cubensis]KAH9474254.1 hypothetical protein JR316_0013417 [Psilocybe cubensis]
MYTQYYTWSPTFSATAQSPQSESSSSSVQEDLLYREMEAYVDYDYGSNRNSTDTSSNTPGTPGSLTHPKRADPEAEFQAALSSTGESVSSSSWNKHHTSMFSISENLAPISLVPIASIPTFCRTPASVPISLPSHKSGGSSVQKRKTLRGAQRSTRTTTRKRTNTRARKVPQRKRHATGVLSPEEVASLPSKEYTESVVQRILGVPPNVNLEGAWPKDSEPWGRYTRIQALILAVCCSPNHRASLEDIETYLMDKYPKLADTPYGKKWRGTFRGYLSHRPEFRRVRRSKAHGDYWTIDVTKLSLRR